MTSVQLPSDAVYASQAASRIEAANSPLRQSIQRFFRNRLAAIGLVFVVVITGGVCLRRSLQQLPTISQFSRTRSSSHRAPTRRVRSRSPIACTRSTRLEPMQSGATSGAGSSTARELR